MLNVSLGHKMVDARSCNGTHAMKELAFFTTGVSVLLFISTFTINLLLIYFLAKNLKTSMFQKLILNIAVADFLTSLISDISSVTFHAQEGLGLEIPLWETCIKHWALFILNGTSVLTMAVLSINRVVAIMYPFNYRRGLERWKGIGIIAITWLASALLTIPYYYLGYIRYLGIFASANIVLTMLCLIGAAIIYSIYLKPSNRVRTSISVNRINISDSSKMNSKQISVNRINISDSSKMNSEHRINISDSSKMNSKHRREGGNSNWKKGLTICCDQKRIKCESVPNTKTKGFTWKRGFWFCFSNGSKRRQTNSLEGTNRHHDCSSFVHKEDVPANKVNCEKSMTIIGNTELLPDDKKRNGVNCEKSMTIIGNTELLPDVKKRNGVNSKNSMIRIEVAEVVSGDEGSQQIPTVELTGIQLTNQPSTTTSSTVISPTKMVDRATKKTSGQKMKKASERSANKSLERSANKSFLLMLIVFLVTYLPAIAMTIYMNACCHCDCVTVHWLRDFTYLAILSSALWRPLNFMLRLKNVRKEVRKMLCWRKL